VRARQFLNRLRADAPAAPVMTTRIRSSPTLRRVLPPNVLEPWTGGSSASRSAMSR